MNGAAPDDYLTCTVEGEGPVRTVELAGELDNDTAPGFEQQMLALVDQGATELRLDLSEVSFLDSAGLRAFLTLRNRLEGSGRLVISSSTEMVQRLLEITGLTDLLAQDG